MQNEKAGQTTGKKREKSFYSFKSPKQKWDCIVIGSGMGGMTSAALLAKAGKKVLLLEQHYVPGGFTHSFRREKWTWDVGVHAIGEVTQHSLVGRVLSSLSGNRLKWASLGKTYEEFYFPDDLRLDFPDHPKDFKNNLFEAFPNDHEAIEAYFKETKKVAQDVKHYYLSRCMPQSIGNIYDKFFKASSAFEKTTSEVLDKLTDNKKLKTVLSAQWGYYGATPDHSAFGIQALVSRHFSHGAFYPIGGSSQIAKELLSTIAENGGWTRVRCSVKEINISKDRVCGVTLKNGEVIEADQVISAVGALESVTRLLPEKHSYPKKWTESIKDLKSSPCHICLHIGFKGDIRKAGASPANQWFWRDWQNKDLNWDFVGNDSVPHILYTSYPSLKDPKHTDQNYHTGEVVTFVPYEFFEPYKKLSPNKRGEEYAKIKAELEQRILDRLLHYMPKLEPMIAYKELSSPLSTEHFTRSYAGSIYGLEPTPKRFTNPYLRPRTPIKGFYLSGCDMGSAGVVGAMVGGILAALSAEPLASAKVLRKSMRAN